MASQILKKFGHVLDLNQESIAINVYPSSQVWTFVIGESGIKQNCDVKQQLKRGLRLLWGGVRWEDRALPVARME